MPSNTEVVLNNSNSPVSRRARRFSEQLLRIAQQSSGLKVSIALKAWSRMGIESSPVITTDVGRLSA